MKNKKNKEINRTEPFGPCGCGGVYYTLPLHLPQPKVGKLIPRHWRIRKGDPRLGKVTGIRLGNKHNPNVGGCWCGGGGRQTKSVCPPCTRGRGGCTQTVASSVWPILNMT